MAIDDITIDAGTCQEGKVINIIFRKMRDEDVCFFFSELQFTATTLTLHKNDVFH